MSEPLVSVVMPVYNVEKYLDASLQSIFSQTYSNIELIAINDGSTDTSGEILKKFINKNKIKSFKFYEQENHGLSTTRNLGISKSTGKYIYFFDSDDLLDRNAILELVNFAEKEKLDIVRFNADAFLDEDFSENFFPITDYKNNNLISLRVYTRDEFISVQDIIPSSVCIYFYKASLLKDNNILFYPSIIHEDELFTPITLINSQNIGYIDSSFFKRRYRSGSIMTSKDKKLKKKHALGYFTVIRELDYLNQEIDSNSIVYKYLKRVIIRIGSMIFLARGLNISHNIRIVTYGINPIKAIYQKIKYRIVRYINIIFIE